MLKIEELYRFAYVKQPLNTIFHDAKSVPPEYLMDWLKDVNDYERLHSDEELDRFRTLAPEEILTWLEEASDFVWEANRNRSSIYT